MGWDIVEIGLNHDLPVDDPFATAKLLAERIDLNVKLVFYDKFFVDKTI